MIDPRTVFLVVDASEPMRNFTRTRLRTMGAVTVHTAGGGAEALRLLRELAVDIVVSEWKMPTMSGLDLLKSVRADRRLARTPFILITADPEHDRVQEAILCGVTDLMVKPYTTDRFAQRVEKALGSAGEAAQPPWTQGGAVPPPAAAPAPGAVQAGPEAERQTILIVDDTPDNVRLLSHLFRDEYRVRTADSGGKALEICRSNTPPDLVLLDVMMPGMDGFQVAREMREHPASETIPVIFVTALSEQDARLRGLELGAVDFVTKPIDQEVLKPRVRNLLRYFRLQKQWQAECDGMLEAARLKADVERLAAQDTRGPLAGVLALVQSLAGEAPADSPQAEALRRVEEAALQALSASLPLELFRIETGRYSLEPGPVEVAGILRRVAEACRGEFAGKHLVIALTGDGPSAEGRPQVLGDAVFCYPLFQNLLRNACEAAPEKSQVLVSLDGASPVRIRVRNSGAIPAGARDRFFAKPGRDGQEGPAGERAYAARLLAEAQRGGIALEVSDADDQTTVTVTLPRFEEAPA